VLEVAGEVDELVLVNDTSVKGNHMTLLVINGIAGQLVLGQGVIVSIHIIFKQTEPLVHNANKLLNSRVGMAKVGEGLLNQLPAGGASLYFWLLRRHHNLLTQLGSLALALLHPLPWLLLLLLTTLPLFHCLLCWCLLEHVHHRDLSLLFL